MARFTKLLILQRILVIPTVNLKIQCGFVFSTFLEENDKIIENFIFANFEFMNSDLNLVLKFFYIYKFQISKLNKIVF
jgi:hypothetical protein